MAKDNQNGGEAVFIPCASPQHTSRPSTSATSSNFQISSSSYESSASVTGMIQNMLRLKDEIYCVDTSLSILWVFFSHSLAVSFFLTSYSSFCLDSTDESTPLNREGAMNKPPSGSEHNVSRGQMDLASRSLGSAMFPDEDTEEGIFHMEVLLAVQRWFSSQGWPGGQFPIIIPHSLRWLAQTICSCCKFWKTL